MLQIILTFFDLGVDARIQLDIMVLLTKENHQMKNQLNDYKHAVKQDMAVLITFIAIVATTLIIG